MTGPRLWRYPSMVPALNGEWRTALEWPKAAMFQGARRLQE